MTPDEINRAIAEHLGWVVPEGCTNNRTRPDGKMIFFNPLSEDDPLPNYYGDLNAMHEAEKALDDYEHDQMRNQLWLLMIKTDRDKTSRRVHSAEAHERAEAFVRAIGKWRDE